MCDCVHLCVFVQQVCKQTSGNRQSGGQLHAIAGPKSRVPLLLSHTLVRMSVFLSERDQFILKNAHPCPLIRSIMNFILFKNILRHELVESLFYNSFFSINLKNVRIYCFYWLQPQNNIGVLFHLIEENVVGLFLSKVISFYKVNPAINFQLEVNCVDLKPRSSH